MLRRQLLKLFMFAPFNARLYWVKDEEPELRLILRNASVKVLTCSRRCCSCRR